MRRFGSTKFQQGALALATLFTSLALVGNAQAAIVTVGAPTVPPLASANIGNPATIIDSSLEPGGILTSPVNGTIIRWHVTGFKGGPFKLRVLTPLGGTNYLGSGTSAPVMPTSTATQTFATSLPIKAGQLVAVDNANATDEEGYIATTVGSYSYFVPPLADGASKPAVGPSTGIQFLYNAEVLPPPALGAIGPAEGPITGGTPVLIAGTNLIEVTGVKFGSVPAAYTVESETVVKAVAPPGVAPGAVGVTVTTLAGVTAASNFTYTACVVPKLGAKKLKAAKKKLRRASCRIGNVKKIEGVTGKTGVVVKQKPTAGKVLAPGSKVSVKLGAG